MNEDYFKIKVEQDVLNNLLDDGKITLNEKYYHKRSIKLMKEAQDFGFQKGKLEQKKEELEFLKAIRFWRSWGKMSIFAQDNINNRIKQLQDEIKEKGK